MSIHSSCNLEFERLVLQKKPSQEFYMAFMNYDDSQIERQLWESKSEKKYHQDLASSTQYQEDFDLFDFHMEKMASEREEKEQDPIQLIEVKKKKSIKKRNNTEKIGKKKDYKKNICGYITKTTVKESFSKEIRPIVEGICDAFGINFMNFIKTYGDYSFITGPTHLDNLITPKLKFLDKEQSRQEIFLRIVFILYYRWFAKNRYLRYMMVEGKMERKGEYINYLNKIILPILFDEENNLVRQFEDLFGNMYKIHGKSLSDYIEHVYESLIMSNSLTIEENEPKIMNHSQKKYISLNNHTETFSEVDKMQEKDEGSFFLDSESFML